MICLILIWKTNFTLNLDFKEIDNWDLTCWGLQSPLILFSGSPQSLSIPQVNIRPSVVKNTVNWVPQQTFFISSSARASTSYKKKERKMWRKKLNSHNWSKIQYKFAKKNPSTKYMTSVRPKIILQFDRFRNLKDQSFGPFQDFKLICMNRIRNLTIKFSSEIW